MSSLWPFKRDTNHCNVLGPGLHLANLSQHYSEPSSRKEGLLIWQQTPKPECQLSALSVAPVVKKKQGNWKSGFYQGKKMLLLRESRRNNQKRQTALQQRSHKRRQNIRWFRRHLICIPEWATRYVKSFQPRTRWGHSHLAFLMLGYWGQ